MLRAAYGCFWGPGAVGWRVPGAKCGRWCSWSGGDKWFRRLCGPMKIGFAACGWDLGLVRLTGRGWFRGRRKNRRNVWEPAWKVS